MAAKMYGDIYMLVTATENKEWKTLTAPSDDDEYMTVEMKID